MFCCICGFKIAPVHCILDFTRLIGQGFFRSGFGFQCGCFINVFRSIAVSGQNGNKMGAFLCLPIYRTDNFLIAYITLASPGLILILMEHDGVKYPFPSSAGANTISANRKIFPFCTCDNTCNSWSLLLPTSFVTYFMPFAFSSASSMVPTM
jgi:hypothetical protein